MTSKELIKHNVKALIRAPFSAKENPGRLFIIAGSVFIIFNLVFLGFFLDSLIKLIYPDEDSIYLLNSALIFLLAFDIFFRSLVQRLPKADFMPYLLLPVKRSIIIHFLIFKSFISFLNLYLILIIVPFLLRTVLIYYGLIYVITYSTGFLLLTITNQLLINILNSLVQKRFLLSFLPFLIVIILFIIRFNLNYPAGIKTAFIGYAILNGNCIVFAALILFIVLLFFLNKITFKVLLSGEIDHGNIIHGRKKIIKNLNFPECWGIIREYMKLELSMICRNKRTRQNICYALFFIFYSMLFLFFNKIFWNSIYVEQFVYLITTAAFTLFHGQLMLSWESSFFDFILAYNITFKNFLKAKYYLFLIINILLGIILFPALLLMQTDLNLFISILIFNTGVTNLLIIYNSIFNTGKIDLSRKAYANWQGIHSKHLLIIIIVVLIPFIISYIIRQIASEFYIYFVFILTGSIAVISHNKWINLIAKEFLKRKYLNVEAYRE